MPTKYRSAMVDSQETAEGFYARTVERRREGDELARVAANYSHAYMDRFDVRSSMRGVCHSTYVHSFISTYNRLWDSRHEQQETAINNAG